MTACISDRCRQGRKPCPTRAICFPLETETDVGHKVAHGRRTDYFGKAAEGNPGYPFELLDSTEPATERNFWQWLQDLFSTFVYIGGPILMGVLLLAAVVWATGLHRVLFN